MKTRTPFLLFLLVVVEVMVSNSLAARDNTDEPPIVKEFADRVTKYGELQKRLEKQLPELKKRSDPPEIIAHREALAKAIRTARSGARQGDIFFPAAQKHFLQIIRNEFKGPGGSGLRAAIMEGNPTAEGYKVRLTVNAPYPDGAPLSMVPPNLLLRFPQLVEGLDYRFVGRDLILHDVKANLIVDFILKAVP